MLFLLYYCFVCLLRQHDLRMSHDCSSDQSKIALVSIYGYHGTSIEAKCLDINQLRTEQLAVGANDPYVRLYDRRMIRSLASVTLKHPFPKNPMDLVFNFDGDDKTLKRINNDPNKIAQYFVPGHVHILDKNKSIGITYLTFSPDGRELLVNYGGEYVYLYDLLNEATSAFKNIPKVMRVPRKLKKKV